MLLSNDVQIGINHSVGIMHCPQAPLLRHFHDDAWECFICNHSDLEGHHARATQRICVCRLAANTATCTWRACMHVVPLLQLACFGRLFHHRQRCQVGVECGRLRDGSWQQGTNKPMPRAEVASISSTYQSCAPYHDNNLQVHTGAFTIYTHFTCTQGPCKILRDRIEEDCYSKVLHL